MKCLRQIIATRALSSSQRSRYCQPSDGLVDFPSDVTNSKQNTRDQTAKAFRPSVDPTTTSILLFPGQGSQFVGMGKKLATNRNAVELYEMASDIVRYDVLKLCMEGPGEELMRTDKCQIATLVTSLAALEQLRHTALQVLESCVATAGFSVGEYAALVFAGALSYQDAVQLVQARALAMQAAADDVSSGLMTVFLTHKSRLNYAMKGAVSYCQQRLNIEKPVCSIANYLFSDVKVIGGNSEALSFIQTNVREFDIKRTKLLPVSGAFHTALMKPAATQFASHLSNVEFREPVIPVHSNVDCTAYRNPSAIKKRLKEQIYKPVKWEQLMHSLYQRKQDQGFPNTYEVGPGDQLGTILKMVNNKAYASYRAVEV